MVSRHSIKPGVYPSLAACQAGADVAFNVDVVRSKAHIATCSTQSDECLINGNHSLRQMAKQRLGHVTTTDRLNTIDELLGDLISKRS